ncbi:myotubularin-related protein 6 isoform X5 [Neophocaena asiaeorientalis asiaeorientalis]|uniref:Myotubularin related protein 6 n=4 Tax=Odontoceti TaxID=9722 RepID=A0A8C6CAD7_MONMO|nr:myotubularin-related protein 6 isoform X3 [Delphinapterus leucas]XP_024607877.1 myotubularin-related protein 6 isoform X5 [Neophocaena asiaeorientalis asiaeorientalis]XP_029066069.1 myotubularin-related protein 6 [Monodon monoceros]XP_032467023.1 myotubularin-related protein 6 isoform X5 [Phocoena sinus]
MEHIRTTKVEQVKLLDRFSTSNKSLTGTLYLTATHLLFIDSHQKETWILHHHIALVEKLALTTSGCPLVIQCKNFRTVHFIVPRERDCHDIYNSLLQLSKQAKYEDLYAFSYNPKQNDSERLRGWQLVDLAEEYKRMGVPNSNWQLSDANRDYKICETYPRELYVPRIASKPIIVGSSKFRSKGRFPVLSYYHQNKEAAICRCSQPLSGFSARCLEDEHLLQAISKANPANRYMYVMDTRPRLNAMANRAAGKGYENEDNYSNIRFQFVGIENIHVMRSSLQKLLEVNGTKGLSVSDFYSGLENAGWLRHIKAVMDAAIFLAKAIMVENASVLVHCSDGWDRTSQVCSLGSLLLDPYYRTIRGFMVLIEKDWISFGHKYSERCGHLDGDPKEVSPVFTQFLECVWHLTEQFPQAFEFNEAFLLQIHEHIHSCQFGNFIGNCQKEREELKLKEKTYSLWPFLLDDQEKYFNPLYSSTSQKLAVLEPNTVSFNFKFWRNMYHQFDRTLHPRQSVFNIIMNMNEQNKQLQKDVKDLESQIKQHKNKQTDGVLTKELLNSVRPESPALRTSLCLKEQTLELPVNDALRTVEGSSPADNRYSEYADEFSKAEPAVVSSEYGVARMTC